MVRIGLARYRGSFNTRTFGEKKPHIGFCHEGELELVYHKVPGLKSRTAVSALDDSVTVELPPLAGNQDRFRVVSEFEIDYFFASLAMAARTAV